MISAIRHGSYETIQFDDNSIQEDEMRMNVLQFCIFLKQKSGSIFLYRKPCETKLVNIERKLKEN